MRFEKRIKPLCLRCFQARQARFRALSADVFFASAPGPGHNRTRPTGYSARAVGPPKKDRRTPPAFRSLRSRTGSTSAYNGNTTGAPGKYAFDKSAPVRSGSAEPGASYSRCEQGRPRKQNAQLVAKIGKTCLYRALSCDKHQQTAVLQIRQIEPVRFAEATLDAVARHGVPPLFGDGDTKKSAAFIPPRKDVQRKGGRTVPLPLAIRAGEQMALFERV